jgi:hypothetical protein
MMAGLKVYSGDGAEAARAEAAGRPLDEASRAFVGRWNRLVSTTNWEKGRIIIEWRRTLVDAGAPARDYSDEAWARRVGAVTGRHVGRLRRVYERFGEVYESYGGLYWSHFHAALDWDDAEMWLEGAVQSDWSVSHMRRQRWEAMGSIEADKPRDKDIVVAEIDEDVVPEDREPPAKRLAGELAEVQGPPIPEGPDFGDEDRARGARGGKEDAAIYAGGREEESIEFVRPFENLAELPDDLAEAFESFKLAILRHKADDWRQVSREDVLAALDALKEMTLAPSPQ